METSLDSTVSTQSQSSGRALNPFGFVQRRLPWIVAGVFILVYGLTLGRWVSYQGLSTLARAGGWDWQLAYHAPLHYLLTYPVRWLPAGWQVIAVNAFSMACSVVTLAILARSVAILPHDRTRDQRQLERNEFSLLGIPGAWLPPIFAALVCGLQLLSGSTPQCQLLKRLISCFSLTALGVSSNIGSMGAIPGCTGCRLCSAWE